MSRLKLMVYDGGGEVSAGEAVLYVNPFNERLYVRTPDGDYPVGIKVDEETIVVNSDGALQAVFPDPEAPTPAQPPIGAGDTFPEAPTDGDLFFHTEWNRILRFDGNTEEWSTQPLQIHNAEASAKLIFNSSFSQTVGWISFREGNTERSRIEALHNGAMIIQVGGLAIHRAAGVDAATLTVEDQCKAKTFETDRGGTEW